MKRAQKLLAAASSKMDVPGEIMAGLPKLELTGFSQLSIEHHKGVLEYSPETVSVDVGIGSVRITGSGLSISCLLYTSLAGKLNVLNNQCFVVIHRKQRRDFTVRRQHCFAGPGGHKNRNLGNGVEGS